MKGSVMMNPFESSGVENFPDLEALFQRFNAGSNSPFSRLDLSLETLSRVTGGLANFTEDTALDFPHFQAADSSKARALDFTPGRPPLSPIPRWRAISGASPTRGATNASAPDVSLDLMLSPIRPILGGGPFFATHEALSPFNSTPLGTSFRCVGVNCSPSTVVPKCTPRPFRTPTARGLFSPASCPPLAPTPQKQLRFDLGPRQLQYDVDGALSPISGTVKADFPGFSEGPAQSASPIHSLLPSPLLTATSTQPPATVPPNLADTTAKAFPSSYAEVPSASSPGLEAPPKEETASVPPAAAIQFGSAGGTTHRHDDRETSAPLDISSSSPLRGLRGAEVMWRRHDDVHSAVGPAGFKVAAEPPALTPTHCTAHSRARREHRSHGSRTRQEERDQQLLRLFQRLLRAMEEQDDDVSEDGASTESGSFSGPDKAPSQGSRSPPPASPIAQTHPSDPVVLGALESSTNLNISSLTTSDGMQHDSGPAGEPPRPSIEKATQTTPTHRPSKHRGTSHSTAAPPRNWAPSAAATTSTPSLCCSCLRPPSSWTNTTLKASWLGAYCGCEGRTYPEANRPSLLSTSFPPWCQPRAHAAPPWSPPPMYSTRPAGLSPSRWHGQAGAAVHAPGLFRLTSHHPLGLFSSSGRSTSVPPRARYRSSSPGTGSQYEEYMAPRWLSEWRRQLHQRHGPLHSSTADLLSSPPSAEYTAVLHRLAAVSNQRRHASPPSRHRGFTLREEWSDSD
eukprot:GGOE01065526.1.p1 GENE.GGOE01065526.1~~GGOE01065526.1.p1  ORF type:complete len:738 (+),score=50.13 GGOE01065526.1:71-2284(+)